MNITSLLDMTVDHLGDRALIGKRSAGLSAVELSRASHAGAHLLNDSGATCVIYLAANGPAFPTALFAAARAGVPFVPVNFRLGEAQLSVIFEKHPGALIIADERWLELLSSLGRKLVHTPERWLDLVGGSRDEFALSPDEGTAAVVYTSGTTSEPKGVLLEHANLSTYVLTASEFVGAGEDEAAVMCVPPYHIAAISNLLTSVFTGRRLVVLDGFDPHVWAETVRSEEVTHAFVVPTMLAKIMELPPEELELPSLRSVAFGGAPMPASVIERALETWGQVGFVNAYGLTETSSTVSILGPEDHRLAHQSSDPEVRARLHSVGRTIPGVEVEIRDVEDRVVPAGTPGRIWIRGSQVSRAYSATGSSLDEHGFFDTRDEGYFDTAGYLFVKGRADDTIIRGGENVAPAEIEAVLLELPEILDAAVVGVPDEVWGQRIEAVVVPRGAQPLDPEHVKDFVRGRLRSSKTPSRILTCDAIPRTESGKLLRREVAKILTAEVGGGRS